MENNEITVELLNEIIDKKQVQKLRTLFNDYHIVDLAELIQELPINHVVFIYKVIKKDITAELFAYLDSEHQEKLIQTFTSNEITEMLDNLYTDDIVDFIEEMPANIVKKVLQSATLEQRAEINLLLSYEDNTAGSIMTTDYVEINDIDTISQAIRKAKKQGKVAEASNHCYVVNDKRELVGYISLRDLIFAPEKTKIEKVMDDDFVSVKTSADQEEVAQMFKKYDIDVIPVVNDENRLIGIITVDDIIDVIEEEATEDIQKMAAITPLEASYLKTSILGMAKSRIIWLLVLMISATFTGYIMLNYEEKLAAIPILSVFIPMLMDTAGNAGGQASVMVIRGLAVGELTVKDYFKILKKELSVAFLCGVGLAVANFLRVILMNFFVTSSNVPMDVNLIVSVSLFLTVVIAKIVGGSMPIFAKLLKQDPAVMASPLITTIVDALALIVYFNLVTSLLGGM